MEKGQNSLIPKAFLAKGWVLVPVVSQPREASPGGPLSAACPAFAARVCAAQLRAHVTAWRTSRLRTQQKGLKGEAQAQAGGAPSRQPVARGGAPPGRFLWQGLL